MPPGSDKRQSISVKPFPDNQREHNYHTGDSLIEEEMTFEELSSKLGPHSGALTAPNGAIQDLLNESRISIRTPDDSLMLESKNKSVDFANIPDLLDRLDDKHNPSPFVDGGGSPPIATTAAYTNSASRSRFDYEQRFFNHFNVNKMTMENQPQDALGQTF